MNNPEYIAIDDRKYKINTDYRYVLRFEKLIKDKNITDYEKLLGTIIIFFGEEGLKHEEDYQRLSNSILVYVKGRPNSTTDKEIKESNEIDMDYEKDFGLIVSSMKSQYGIDIINEEIHWWTFFDYLNGLSSECVLNRVREIRRRKVEDEKDEKVKKELIELKKIYSLDKEERELTEQEKQGVDMFYKLTGIERK